MPGQGIAARNLTLRSHFGFDRNPTLSLPVLQFALFRGDPSGAGVIPGVEPSGGGYGRVAKNNDSILWGTFGATDVFAVNKGTDGSIVFPPATDLYTITEDLDWWAIFDSTSGGALWYWGLLSTPIRVTAIGDIPRLPASTLICNQPA